MIALAVALLFQAQPDAFDALSRHCTDAELEVILAGGTQECGNYVRRPGWDGVELTGWSVRRDNGEMMMLTRAASQRSMLWVRYEFQDTENGYRSTRLLMEYDCSSGRSRTVQSAQWDGPGMTGHGTAGPLSGWSYVAPDTYDELAMRQVCYFGRE